MKQIRLLLPTLMSLFLLSGCSSTDSNEVRNEVTISAAASLQDALLEIKSAFEVQYPNVKIQFNFGSSGALQQQIKQGAPVDLFFSAAEDKFDQLVKDGLITSDLTTDLVGNELVLIVPKNVDSSIHGFEELPSLNLISIGTPEAVPAGQYAREVLKTLNIWKPLQGKMVYAKDVRQVLTYVETGNVDAGIVYKTDALTSKKVNIVATASQRHHRPIVYPVGVVSNSKFPDEAELFYEFVQNDQSLKTLKEHGFKGLK